MAPALFCPSQVTHRQTPFFVFLIFAALAGAGGFGCAAASSPAQRWVESCGGTVSGPAQERARSALARLQVNGWLERPLTVTVLRSDRPGAYCWRSGAIFVTQGLIGLLDDDELTAAVAHEAGHLVADGHIPRNAALDGYRRARGTRVASIASVDAEVAADRMGRELLRDSGIPDRSIERLLVKLASTPAMDPRCREHLHLRVAALRATD